MDELDRIERHIDIDADAERVWGLVSRPGWWINEGEILSNQAVEQRGDDHLVSHAVYGDFRIRTELLDPPRYAAFRWLPQESDDVPSDATTLVEFRIEDRAGGVRLSVVESGFSTLSDDRSVWLDGPRGERRGLADRARRRARPPRPGGGHPLGEPAAAARAGVAAARRRRPARALVRLRRRRRRRDPGRGGRAALGGARHLPRSRARGRTARDVLVPPRRRARRRPGGRPRDRRDVHPAAVRRERHAADGPPDGLPRPGRRPRRGARRWPTRTARAGRPASACSPGWWPHRSEAAAR